MQTEAVIAIIGAIVAILTATAALISAQANRRQAGTAAKKSDVDGLATLVTALQVDAEAVYRRNASLFEQLKEARDRLAQIEDAWRQAKYKLDEARRVLDSLQTQLTDTCTANEALILRVQTLEQEREELIPRVRSLEEEREALLCRVRLLEEERDRLALQLNRIDKRQTRAKA